MSCCKNVGSFVFPAGTVLDVLWGEDGSPTGVLRVGKFFLTLRGADIDFKGPSHEPRFVQKLVTEVEKVSF